MLTSLSSGNLMWANPMPLRQLLGQYQECYTGNINCTGRTNVYVALQKQLRAETRNNMNACEYSRTANKLAPGPLLFLH